MRCQILFLISAIMHIITNNYAKFNDFLKTILDFILNFIKILIIDTI